MTAKETMWTTALLSFYHINSLQKLRISKYTLQNQHKRWIIKMYDWLQTTRLLKKKFIVDKGIVI